MNKSENEIGLKAISRLQNETAQLIAASGRPDQLFKIKPDQAALVVIDMQNFVCAPEEGKNIPGIEKIIKNINRLANTCRNNTIPVIWVRHNINTDGDMGNGGLYPLFHSKKQLEAIENKGPGTEIYNKLQYEQSTDFVVFKSRYSAFLPSPSALKVTLDSLNIKQLIITGVATNVCVESTVRDAMQMDYEVIVISDATTTYNDIVLENALMNIRLFFGDVRSGQSVINEIDNVQ